MKKVLVVILVLILVAAAVVGFFLWRNSSRYIGAKAAIDIAVADAAIQPATIVDSSADFESNKLSAWYDVELDTHSTEYDYVIDAVSGEILNSASRPAD